MRELSEHAFPGSGAAPPCTHALLFCDVLGGRTVRPRAFIAEVFVGCGFGARFRTFEPTLTLEGRLRHPLRLSVAFFGFALPLERRGSTPLCHVDSLGHPAGFYASWRDESSAGVMRSTATSR